VVNSNFATPAGKSTLLKLMTGELQPTEGDVKRHSHLSIAKYHQHSVDALIPELTVLDFFQVPPCVRCVCSGCPILAPAEREQEELACFVCLACPHGCCLFPYPGCAHPQRCSLTYLFIWLQTKFPNNSEFSRAVDEWRAYLGRYGPNTVASPWLML
jgi:energy-coupling factor transporter ATP-binding protein EcfA2